MVVASSAQQSVLLNAQEKKSDQKRPADLVDIQKIPKYTAFQTSEKITVDGKLNEGVWKSAKKTERFIDLISGAKTIHNTQAAIVWDQEYLYIGFWVEEPNLAAKFKKRDSPIYNDNDIEVFIAGDDSYYEFELNGFNTIYEAVFIWDDRYEKGEFSKIPEFQKDHKRVQPFNGVGYKTHPRGKRTGCFDWDFPGMKTAVAMNGTLNDKSDKDKEWTVELAFPWKGMAWLGKADKRAVPPNDGDQWQIDLFRFNQYKADKKDSGGWSWARHGVWDSHVPELFPKVTFSKSPVAKK